MIYLSDIKAGDFITQILMVYSVSGFQLVRANGEPNNLQVVDFGTEEQGEKGLLSD